MGSNPMTNVLIRKEKFGHIDIEEKHQVTKEAKIEVMCLQRRYSKVCGLPPEAR